MNTKQLIKALSKALVEKDVENAYRMLLDIGIPKSEFSSPHSTDGVMRNEDHNLIALLEFKYDYDFKTVTDQVKVLIQVLYYLKKFEAAGELMPQVIFVGDVNECFVIGVDKLQKYLSYDLDWTTAPSAAANKNHDLSNEMYKDKDINPYVLNVDDDFDFGEVVNKMLAINKNIQHLVKITPKNINKIFNDFCDKILTKRVKISTNKKVEMFINILTNKDDYYIHPKKKNTLITPTDTVNVKGKNFKAFFNHFERDYSPSEKEELVSICDRLIDDYERRMQGAFFTPSHVVDAGHEMIEKELGSDWKDKYVVWDNAAGTGNLTRDCGFNELYSSTLLEEEHDIKMQNMVNPEATHFVYDFLNTETDQDLPEDLLKAFEEDKPVVFFLNPPYGTAKSGGTKEGDHKEGIAKTYINGVMLEDKIGACAQQLYAQFLYKINLIVKQYALTNVCVALFSKQLFLTGKTYKKFRSNLALNYKDGFIINAGHFNNTSTQWGVMFSIWRRHE